MVTEHRSSYKESLAARAIFEKSSPSLSHPQHYIGTIDSLLTTCMCGWEPVESSKESGEDHWAPLLHIEDFAQKRCLTSTNKFPDVSNAQHGDSQGSPDLHGIMLDSLISS